MRVSVPNDFNFHECLHFLNRSPLERMHLVENGSVRKLIEMKDGFCLIEVRNDTGEDLAVHGLNRSLGNEIQKQIMTYVGEWFDLDRDLKPFYELIKDDAVLAGLVRKYRGARLIRIPDLFHALCWAILGQQINLKFAFTLYSRFIENYGESVEHRGRQYWFFPRPERIVTLQRDQLKKLQFTGNKADFIIGVARAIYEEKISKNSLQKSGDINEARKQLLQIRGVGPWTANYVLMRCLGFQDAFPIEDIGLHNAIKNVLKLEKKPTIDEINELAAAWSGWRAYATFYLYRSLL